MSFGKVPPRLRPGDAVLNQVAGASPPLRASRAISKGRTTRWTPAAVRTTKTRNMTKAAALAMKPPADTNHSRTGWAGPIKPSEATPAPAASSVRPMSSRRHASPRRPITSDAAQRPKQTAISRRTPSMGTSKPEPRVFRPARVLRIAATARQPAVVAKAMGRSFRCIPIPTAMVATAQPSTMGSNSSMGQTKLSTAKNARNKPRRADNPRAVPPAVSTRLAFRLRITVPLSAGSADESG